MKIFIKFKGEDYLKSANTLVFLGKTLLIQGKYDMALHYYQKALNIFERHLGPGHLKSA